MLLYSLDFTDLTESVSLDDNEELYRSNLGTIPCKILSTDFNKVVLEISNLICESISSGAGLPFDRIKCLISDIFSEKNIGDFKDTRSISTFSWNIFASELHDPHPFSQTDRPFQEICTDRIYDLFKVFIAIQAYLDEAVDSPALASPVAFEQFAVGCLDMEIPKEICAESLSEYDFFDRLFFGCDVRNILRDDISDLWLHNGDHIYIQTEYLSDLLLESIYYVFFHHYAFKRCKNCNCFFIPLSRSDEIYCNNPSPQDSTKTCKQYGSERLWYERLKEDEAAKLSRNVYAAKSMLARRNPDIEAYAKMRDYFKAERKKWESDLKNGTRTKEEYICWLNEMKKKKTL